MNSIDNSNSKISSFLTIQEGCDKFCKFCVVPYTRGPEFSRSVNEILVEANRLVNNGAKEITLLGQNVNAYNFKNKKLSDLLFEIAEIKNLKRIRYTTSHPKDFTDDLIDAHKNCEKLMPLIHLPIQSGSNKILKEMNRKHTVEEYLNIINKLLIARSDLRFSSDFIISYPGETKEDFQESIKLINQIKFINIYSFIYSERPGTPAFNLKKMDDKVSKKRLYEFQSNVEKIKTKYKKDLIGKKMKVLFENKVKNEDKYFGRDEYFNSVIVKSNTDLTGEIKDVRILNSNQNTMYGEVTSNLSKTNFAA